MPARRDLTRGLRAPAASTSLLATLAQHEENVRRLDALIEQLEQVTAVLRRYVASRERPGREEGPR